LQQQAATATSSRSVTSLRTADNAMHPIQPVEFISPVGLQYTDPEIHNGHRCRPTDHTVQQYDRLKNKNPIN